MPESAPRIKPVAIVPGKKLSLPLAETLGVISLFQKIYGLPPSQREIAKILKRSHSCIHDRVFILVKADLIHNDYYASRQIRIVCDHRIDFIPESDDDLLESFAYEDLQTACENNNLLEEIVKSATQGDNSL